MSQGPDWEEMFQFAFWTIGLPVVVYGLIEHTGHMRTDSQRLLGAFLALVGMWIYAIRRS